MKNYCLLLIVLFFSGFIFAGTHVNLQHVIAIDKLPGEVIFSLEQGKLKVHFVTENIAQVVFTPTGQFSKRKSLSIIDIDNIPVVYSLSEDSKYYRLKTAQISIHVSKLSATVSFFDATGKPLLQESENGRILEKNKILGDTAFIARQNWISQPNEANYGLGQYQYDIINWHNGYMRMQQKNTAIAMPVVISNNGYGLFWDNYSLTEFNPDLKRIPLISSVKNDGYARFLADQTGEYTFVIDKDDWNPLEIYGNDSLVYAHYAGVSYPTKVFKMHLIAGKVYDFRMKNIDKPVYPTISAVYLHPKDGTPGEKGLKGEYFDNKYLQGTPVFVRTDSIIDFNWGDGSPKAGFKNDAFSVRWSGTLIGSKSMKNATINLTTDDGVRLFIDGKKVIENWVDRGPQTDSYTFSLEEGKAYPIVIEYYESDGGASARLSWNGQEQTGDNDFMAKMKFFYRSPDMGTTMSFQSQIADGIDYYFIQGENADKIIAGLRTITGKAPLYPKWAYGLFMSQYGWKDQPTIQGLIDGYRERKIPVDVIVQDMDYWTVTPNNRWGSHIFDPIRYPNPTEMVDYLHQKNAHIIISVWPRINQGTDVYDSMASRHYLLGVQQTQGIAGEGVTIENDSPNAAYDPFNKGARDMYWDFMNKRLFSKGFDGWWMDASEPEWGYDFSRAITDMGSGKRYLNAYPLMAKKGVYEGQLSTGSLKRPFILTRSSFVGQQRYATTTWSGDIGPDWSTFRKQIPAGLNFCLTGMPYWTNDIGGFAVYDFVQTPQYPELLVRWFEYGTFLPIFRVHGCRKTPFWNYDLTTQDILKKYTNLRYRLMPFIYSLGAKVTDEHFTIYRALMMDFAQDLNVLDIQDQFMFGHEIMVCPVITPAATARSVYFPKTIGGWFDFWTGEKLPGGETRMVAAPLNHIPLYVKAGSVLPMGPFVQYANENKNDTLEIRIFKGANGEFQLYEDEGDNFNYQEGKSTQITFTWDDKNQYLTISDCKGNFNGMLLERIFKIICVKSKLGIGIGLTTIPDQLVHYRGKMIKMKLK